jgi:hypothetical protein
MSKRGLRIIKGVVYSQYVIYALILSLIAMPISNRDSGSISAFVHSDGAVSHQLIFVQYNPSLDKLF